MARGTGTANLAASLEVLAGAPLDARTVVPTVEDLTLSSNFPYKYVGLPVVVQATGDLYILTGNDVTVAANWKKVGDGGSSGGSDNVVEGYYNTTDHLFYEDSSYTTLITGASEVIYVALDTNKTYRYNGLLFVRLDEESGGGGGGGHTIVNESGTEMAQEDKLQFTSGLRVTDDDENLSTKVEADLMQAVDMSEVIPALPGVMARSIYNNRFNRSDLYSTDEVLIGKWIDGKPLYQKTISLGAGPNATTKNVAHGISDIETVVDMQTMMIGNAQATSGMRIPINFTTASTSSGAATWVFVDGSNISIGSGTDRRNFDFYTTIRYTKTGDGQTKVAFDKDYSTDETIIGKWIDGKPLYQKTIDCGTLPNNTIKNVAHNISNLKRVINLYGYAYASVWSSNIPLPYVHTSVDSVLVDVLGSNIRISSTGNESNYTESYVTLQYTKTTD